MLYKPLPLLHSQSLYCLHFASGETEAQRGEGAWLQVTWLGSERWPAAPTCRSDQLFSPQYNKHLFVHIGQSSPSYSDPYLEAVDIRQIYDKFPEKKGGLKELFERGPSNAFFLVKFWVSLQ